MSLRQNKASLGKIPLYAGVQIKRVVEMDMSVDIDALSNEIQRLEDELERKYREQGKLLVSSHVDKAVKPDAATRAVHRELKSPLVAYFRNLPLRVHLTSPFVYGMIIPFAFLDLCVIIFQAVCFWAWKIEKVKRSDHIAVDRHHLAYLNGIEKLNCAFCGYANGVVSFTREVAGRTEEFWCPIKHARRAGDPHSIYNKFTEYGDAQAWQKQARFPNFYKD